MAAHARSESARRVSDCVTALLRDQPFFGSLALRLPIRPTKPARPWPATAKTSATRPSGWQTRMPITSRPRWRRVVLACALKHHTRRGGRDPGALATGLAAGHPRPAARRRLHSAARGRGLGRHQRRAGLRPAPGTVRRWGDQSDACPSGNADDSGGAVGPQAGDGGDDQNDPSDPTDDGNPQEQDESGSGSNISGSKPSGQMPPATTLAAPARSWTRTNAATTTASPANRRWTRRRGAGVGRSHAPGREPRTCARQRAGRRRRDDPAAHRASSTGGRCCAAT